MKNLASEPWPGVRAVLREWVRNGKIDEAHADALLAEIRDDLREDTETRLVAYEQLKVS